MIIEKLNLAIGAITNPVWHPGTVADRSACADEAKKLSKVSKPSASDVVRQNYYHLEAQADKPAIVDALVELTAAASAAWLRLTGSSDPAMLLAEFGVNKDVANVTCNLESCLADCRALQAELDAARDENVRLSKITGGASVLALQAENASLQKQLEMAKNAFADALSESSNRHSKILELKDDNDRLLKLVESKPAPVVETVTNGAFAALENERDVLKAECGVLRAEVKRLKEDQKKVNVADLAADLPAAMEVIFAACDFKDPSTRMARFYVETVLVTD